MLPRRRQVVPHPCLLQRVNNNLSSVNVLTINSLLTLIFVESKIQFHSILRNRFPISQILFQVLFLVFPRALFENATENRHYLATVADRSYPPCLRLCHISYRYGQYGLPLAHHARQQSHLRKLPAGAVFCGQYFLMAIVVCFFILFWEQFILSPPTSSLL